MNEQKQNTLYLKYHNSLFIFISIIIISCSNEVRIKTNNKYDVLSSYFNDVHKYSLSEKISGIVILSEDGCLNCSRQFADFISMKKDNSKLLYIITASGNSIDISAFLKDKSIIVLFDNKDEFSNLGLLKGSGIIFLNNQKIDTIIELKAIDLDYQFSFISKKLNNI